MVNNDLNKMLTIPTVEKYSTFGTDTGKSFFSLCFRVSKWN